MLFYGHGCFEWVSEALVVDLIPHSRSGVEHNMCIALTQATLIDFRLFMKNAAYFSGHHQDSSFISILDTTCPAIINCRRQKASRRSTTTMMIKQENWRRLTFNYDSWTPKWDTLCLLLHPYRAHFLRKRRSDRMPGRHIHTQTFLLPPSFTSLASKDFLQYTLL